MNLRELSSLLGLSPTTVSRALGGYSDVSPATRAEVRRAAETYGYAPNPLAQRLTKGRTDMVGIVLPTGQGHFNEPFFLELLAAIGQRLAAAELDLVVLAAPAGEDEVKAYRKLVAGRRVDALIVARTRRRDERIRFLLDRDFPFIAHGRTEDPRPYPFIDIDGEDAFRRATRRLLGFGHRRIALLNAPQALTFAGLRETGYRRALAEAAIDVDPRLILAGEASEETGFRLTRRLLKLEMPPTAFLCATDLIAVGCLRALADAGLRAGRDASVIGHDNLSLARFTDPPLTTLDQSVGPVGARLVDMLLQRIDGRPAAELCELRKARLVARASDGPAPDRPASRRRRR